MADDDRDSASTRIPGVIPHFYYDVIGRILPGAYLLFGFLALIRNSDAIQSARSYFTAAKISAANGSFLIVALTAGLLISGSASYLVGFLFGSVAFYVERCLGRKSLRNLHELVSSFGMSPSQEQALRRAFRQQFHFNIDTDELTKDEDSTITPFQRLTETSTLCSYYVWANSPNLGYMTSRWDAETLASRSMCAFSLLLFMTRVIQMAISEFRNCTLGSLWALLFFASIGLVALLQYGFQRRKQIQGRFSLFQALRATLHQEEARDSESARAATQPKPSP